MGKIKKRNLSLDLIRVIAVFMVIMIHVCGKFVSEFNDSSAEFIIGNIFDSISHIGVPLFVMVSGALMLDERKNLNVKRLFCKNILNIVLLLMFWSAVYDAVYNVFLPLSKGEVINIKRVTESFVYGHFHLWYLYMIIGLYLVTPFLRKITNKENKNLVLLFIAISLVTQFTVPLIKGLKPIFESLYLVSGFINKLKLGFFSGYITYYLTGWYLVHVGINKKRHKQLIYALSVISLALIIIYVQKTTHWELGYANVNLFVYLYSIGVFLFFNNIKTEKIKAPKLLTALSSLTFGVYIVHIFIETSYRSLIPYSGTPLLYIIVMFIVITLISFLICYIISKIPYVKKIIRG